MTGVQTCALPISAVIRALYGELPFNDVDRTRTAIRDAGDRLAVVVVEPIVVMEPTREWLETLRAETTRAGAVLVFDEIKTAFRVAVGGVAERAAIHPDLVVLGKALANGFLASRGADFHGPGESRVEPGRLPALHASLTPVWSKWAH